MNLTQILQMDCIKVPLSSRNKEAAISELIDVLNNKGLLSNKDVALDAVLTRERSRSTGIGSGIAIPHGKCSAVKKLVMAVGIARDAIDFASIDKKPVKIIILLVSPLDQTGPHIQALARISRIMLDESLRQRLENAASASELYQTIAEKEAE